VILDYLIKKYDNFTNISYFTLITCGLAFTSAICCFLTYSFPVYAAEMVFIVFISSLFIEILISRVIYCLLLSIKLHYSKKKAAKEGKVREMND
jgi:hypothetical protein